MRFPHLTGLWHNPDFVRFWAADTISVFGSLVTRAALPFTAILALDAGALEVALLAVADLLPAFLVALPVGAIVDRLHRRPILIAADIGRAVLLASIPVAALLDALTLGQLYIVAFLASVLTMFFDVAYLSYLPSIVRKEELHEANSKISATQSISEVSAFGVSGWLVQALSGPGAIALDALSFLFSAAFLRRIRAPEISPNQGSDESVEHRTSMYREVREGVGTVVRDSILRPLAGVTVLLDFSGRIVGAVISLFALRELGFEAGVLGMIYAVGGITSLLGALASGSLNRRLGVGPAMIFGLALYALSAVLTPLAPEVSVVAALVLIGAQLGDGGATIYMINDVTVRQSITPDRLLGRVNATMRMLGIGAMLLGALAGGILGETIGLRATLAIGAAGVIVAALWLAVSPVRRLGQLSVAPSEHSPEGPPLLVS
jgi:MFS family permease